MLAEDLVHHELHLVDPILSEHFVEFLLEVGHVVHTEGVLSLVRANHGDALVHDCPAHCVVPLQQLGLKLLDVDSVLGEGFVLIQYELAWQLHSFLVKVGKVGAQQL